MSKPFIAEYFWSGGLDNHTDLRSKCKTITNIPIDAKVDQYPEWNFDGSSTGQNIGKDTEVLLKPCAVYPHPFVSNATLVLCECYHVDGVPTRCNTRAFADFVFSKYGDQEPMFGCEQEYFIMGKNGRPYGWPENGFPAPQGDYYCGNGEVAYGREIALEHYQACLFCGLKISGTNAEVAPGQWEFQIGPCIGIEEGDHMMTARFLFKKISEKYGVSICYDPKPIKGDWNGTGCHTNYSTKAMRAEGGYDAILKAIGNQGKHREQDMPYYGSGNRDRLTGHHETASFDDFCYDVGTRDTSIRIPNMTSKFKKGYYEDRRPAGNMDPYQVTARVFLSSMDLPELAAMPPPDSWKDRAEKKAEWPAQCPDFKPKPCMLG